MIPHIAEGGKSFRGALSYYLHDRNAETSERVPYTDSVNLASRGTEQAWKEMAWTAMHQAELKREAGVKATGRKLEKPVYAYSLNWAQDERPSHAEMGRAARESLRALGMEEHQAVFAVHTDAKQAHIHVIVNRVHPTTGKAASTSKDRLKLSQWAEAYEREQGQVRVQGRVENNARRRQGEFVVDRKSRERDRAQFADWRQERQRQAGAAVMRAQYREASGQREHAGETRATRQAREQSAAGAMRDQYRRAKGQREPVPEKARPDAARERQDAWDRQAQGQREAANDRGRQRPREGQETARQKFRFEEWANTKRAEQQSAQHDARGQLGERHGTQRMALDEKLATTYGPGREDAAQRLAETEARQARGGRFYRLSGRAERDRQAAEAARRTLDNIAMREGEQRGALEAKHAAERSQQAEAQQRERQGLEERINNARDRREREGWRDTGPQRQAGAERANDNSADRQAYPGRERSRDFGWER